MTREMYLINRLKTLRTEENANIIDDTINYIYWQQFSKSSRISDDDQDYLVDDSDENLFDDDNGWPVPEKDTDDGDDSITDYWSGPGDNRRDGYSEFDIDE